MIKLTTSILLASLIMLTTNTTTAQTGGSGGTSTPEPYCSCTISSMYPTNGETIEIETTENGEFAEVLTTATYNIANNEFYNLTFTSYVEVYHVTYPWGAGMPIYELVMSSQPTPDTRTLGSLASGMINCWDDEIPVSERKALLGVTGSYVAEFHVVAHGYDEGVLHVKNFEFTRSFTVVDNE